MGGAIYNDGFSGESSPILKNISFYYNKGAEGGGAMLNDGQSGGKSNPHIIDCSFSQNNAISGKGGAVYNVGQDNGESSPNILGGSFTYNSANHGGAMCNNGKENGKSNPNIEGVTFSQNDAIQLGGAIYNQGEGGESSPNLYNIRFLGNDAGTGGGAIFNDGFNNGSSSPILTNVIFSGNYAEFYGGAINNYGNTNGESKPILTNVTFSGNAAGDYGGAIFCEGGDGGVCSQDVRNSIFWNNKDSTGVGTISASIYNYTSSVTLTNSLVQGAFPANSWIGGNYINGGGNIDKDPLFIDPVDPEDAPTTAGDLRISNNSPAVDAGNNDFVTGIPLDLEGQPRVKDGNGDGSEIVDMGAFEVWGYYKLNVKKAGSGNGSVTSSPPGINCGNTCGAIFFETNSITLTAVAGKNSKFNGWSGACSGTEKCTLAMDANKSVTANFEATLHVDLPLVFR